MGATKYELYDDTFIILADLIKAIAHPARLKSLLLIANQTEKDLSTQEILAEFKLSRSTVAQHLRQLRDVGLVGTKVRTRTEDKKSCLHYRINKIALCGLKKLMNHLLIKADFKNDNKHLIPPFFYSKFTPVSNWDWCADP